MARQVRVLVFHAKTYAKHETERLVDKIQFEVKEIEDMPNAFAEAIGGQYIDIVKRAIGNKSYNIIYEDFGGWNDDFVISLLDPRDQTKNVFGSVAIAGIEDNYSELTDLSDEDIANIVSRIGYTTRTIQGKETISPVIVLGSIVVN